MRKAASLNASKLVTGHSPKNDVIN